ncbi:isoleucyl-tRNA synthetase [Deferribacter desulfuricans SSM1]|uniref:Isoleucine--tRNA ligase n=1 Tax=Deferribacter desulfuricans (strain DSM 14783 / JCM 11476 / NBRC 101012 / SSM1) TaxID=639282 RepID=D3PDI1_DEFDS|nr:isoleucine--tRNA ligase [Deferribacter desulfuricans]BAI80654.1 isoleucyl-tRNA synthetase [Deferribacter desulfuricans SSM1]
MDYKDTLNLPKTNFPMKANLTKNEPLRLKKWEDSKVYEKILSNRDDNKKYILHDGPPYANGHLHMGHALNKILKDFIIKTKSGFGFKTPYVPGWDCHGLPIEHQVDKELGKKKDSIPKHEKRKHCRAYAEKFINIQREEFKRLGVFGDWENPYITMDFAYEANTLKELYKFFNNGGAYKGLKPVYWCISCVTALAEAEVEYHDHTSPSIYVKFPLQDDAKKALGIETEKAFAVIWTTTPWTIPANLGIALNPEFEYALLKVKKSNNKNIDNDDILVLAKELVERLVEIFEIEEYDIIKTFNPEIIENKNAKHPFYDRNSLFVLGNHVTLEQGTGLVHTAPGHGQEDYEVGLKYGLEILNPVDDYGNFKKDTELFAGQNIFKANQDIINLMDENKTLIRQDKVEHSYPHCWRCKNPVVFRATPQWFISMEKNDLRKKALEEIDKNVTWIPKWGRNRIYSMIEHRPDWCISRQRSWGVPIAVFLCGECGEIILNEEIQEKVLSEFYKQGADIWFEKDVEYFIGDASCPKCGSKNIRKETDILDVWFDSGVSHAAVCEVRKELGWPADMYLEGSDQHRGWFHSSLLESVGTRGRAPYKEVLTHGFVVDGKGLKMSKSLGNVITPDEIIDKYGAEILRLWVAAEDYTEDVRISNDIIKRLVESYRKIRNTMRYLLGNLYDFNPDENSIPFEKLKELDKYILMRWQEVKKRIYKAYENYQFHIFYHTLINFCINDLSAFYLDIIKDRVYAYKNDSFERRSAQSTMFTLAKEMAIVMNPILSFTADEVWEFLPNFDGKQESVFIHTFPELLNIDDNSLIKKMEALTNLKAEINKACEIARRNKIIGHSLDAKVIVGIKNVDKDVLDVDEGIEKIFIVSEFVLEDFDKMSNCYTSEDGSIKVQVEASALPKCERCWTHAESVGKIDKHPTICERCANQLI